jgi:hypothetical protein
MSKAINVEREKAEGSITFREYHERYRLPEQAEAEELLFNRKHFVLGWAPGKSKSYPLIAAIRKVNRLKNREAKVLILSDAGTINDMWEAEIRPQGILPARTVLLSSTTAASGVKKPKKRGAKSRIEGLSKQLIDTHWDILVVDECQSLRSGVTRGKTNFAKLVWQIASKTEYVWGMTGTLSGNNDIEPFCVLHALHVANCGQLATKWFEMTYCEKELTYTPFGAINKPVRLNEKGIQFMSKTYEQGVMFWDYDEHDDMPDFDVSFIEFDIEPHKWYNDSLKGILQCGEHESTVIKAAAIQKAQQSLNGFIYYDEHQMAHGKPKKIRRTFNIPDFVNPKLAYVIDEAKKVPNMIVAYRFQVDRDNLFDCLNAAGIQACDDIQEFKRRAEAGEHIVLVLQAVRGKAVNLQVCQRIIYYTSDFSFISYKQLIHRCWRRGQGQACTVTFLINDPRDKQKVEFKIWQAMRKKQSIHDLLMAVKEEKCVEYDLSKVHRVFSKE